MSCGRGDESLLIGIMGWTSPRMLERYRPYDVRRALAEHARHSPLKAAELDVGTTQPRLL